MVSQLENLDYPINIDENLKLIALFAPWRLEEAESNLKNRIPGLDIINMFLHSSFSTEDNLEFDKQVYKRELTRIKQKFEEVFTDRLGVDRTSLSINIKDAASIRLSIVLSGEFTIPELKKRPKTFLDL